MKLDFAFTEHDTPALRARIERDLERIGRRVREADRALGALVLTGGFSRGEGTSRADEPVNDYDLVAIRERPGGDALYARLSEELSRDVGLHVDLLPVWRARLPHVGRKLFWLDLRLGGRVIDGDPRALERLRPLDGHAMPHREVARLLGNRAAGMLLSLPAPGEPEDPLQRDLQATKAALAAMDAILLHRGRYAPGMRERLALTMEHRDHATFAHAVAWKLDAQHALPAGWWDQARGALLRAVDETHARRGGDGPIEHALHLAKARRVRRSPSHRIRVAAWDLLAISLYPEGPAHLPSATQIVRELGMHSEAEWGSLKRSFFAARDRTLQ